MMEGLQENVGHRAAVKSAVDEHMALVFYSYEAIIMNVGQSSSVRTCPIKQCRQ